MIRGFTERCACVLSEYERAKADAFLTADLRAHFLQQRAFRRYCGALAAGSSRALIADRIHDNRERASLPRRTAEVVGSVFHRAGTDSSAHGLRHTRIGVDIEDETESLEATKLAQSVFLAGRGKGS